MKKTQLITFAIPVLVGVVSGFLILHPLSMIIVDYFQQAQFSFLSFAARVQGSFFLPMGFYFSILGGIIGLLFSLRTYKLNKTNTELGEIIKNIELRNEGIREKTDSKDPMISSVVKEMRPTLNKIQNLVDLVTGGNAGSLTIRQSTLLSITKGNVDHLFYVIEYLLSILEKRTAETDGKNKESTYFEIASGK